MNTIMTIILFCLKFLPYICVFIPDDDMDVDRPHLDLTGLSTSSAPSLRTAPVLIPQQPPSSYDVSQLISTLQRDSSRQNFIPPKALYEAIHR